jgi:cytochrome c biogenesis factor
MTQLGELALWIALLMAVWSAIVSFAGGAARRPELVRSGERGVHAVLAFSLLGAAGLLSALLANDFSVRYVAAFTSTGLAGRYTVAGLWAGPAGTTVLWSVMLASAATLSGSSARAAGRTAGAYTTGILAAVLTVILTSVTVGGGPFERLLSAAVDGSGLHPRLQHPAMLLQPPVLYAGLALTAVPFSVTFAALLARRDPHDWLTSVRRWAVVSWVLVSSGILLGVWWSYAGADHSGWLLAVLRDGAALPWLALTAWLYAGTERQRRRTPAPWTAIFVVTAFPLAVLAALVTSGAIARGRVVAGSAPAALTVIVMLALLAAGPLVALGLRRVAGTSHADGSARHGRRQYAWLLVYAGAVSLGAAAVGSAFEARRPLQLSAGEAVEVVDPYGREWRFASDGISHYTGDDRRVTAAVVAVYRSGEYLGALASEVRQHVDSRGAPTFEPITIPAIVSSPLQDVRVVLAGVDETGDRASVDVSFLPLAWWLWVGGVLVIAGGAIVSWPAAAAGRERGPPSGPGTPA